MDARRRFNARERFALYLASGGHCANCGTPLERGWHADHVVPFVAGGPTDVANGQALCAACNLKKGANMSIDERPIVGAEFRDWQLSAIQKFHKMRRPADFLVSATPGAGKTTMALGLARQLLDEQAVELVVVVVPTDTLRTQWADSAAAFGIDLLPARDAADYFKDGYHGTVVTYAQMARGVGADSVRIATRRPMLAIIDEIHHAGDQRSWGDGLQDALELAAFRIALTGTPWRRSSQSPIPFVRYDDGGKVVPDYPYEYGRAVADGVCRRVEFHAYDGDARWHDCGKVIEGSLGADLADEDVSVVLDAALHPYQPWIRTLLEKADEKLTDLRRDVHDAGGLVVADSQWHAHEYGKLLKSITGEDATVIVSDDPSARSKIEMFRKGNSKWAIAVRMISEGVDIPRLAVGVYATKARTPLIFRQIVGRFIRVRRNEEINALLLMPAVPALMAHGREIEEQLRHQLAVEQKRERAEREEDSQQALNLREVLSATEAIFDRTIVGGEELNEDELLAAMADCRAYGLPTYLAANVARLLRAAGKAVPEASTRDRPTTPRHRQEKLLRGQITSLVNKLASRRQCHPQDVNRELIAKGFPRRDKADIEDLERMISDLEWEVASHGR